MKQSLHKAVILNEVKDPCISSAPPTPSNSHLRPNQLQKMRTFSALLTLATLFVTFTATNKARAEEKPDPMLKAMQAELDREKALLVLPGMQRPYFIEYRLDEQSTYEAIANYGALTREESNQQRVVRVTVRVGSYEADSSTSRGDGSVLLAPQDNDPAALRYALWTATDEAYKNALNAYSTKQAALKRFQSSPTADDFAPAKATVNIEPLVSIDLDRAEWKRRIIEASGLYSSDPAVKATADHVQSSTANVRGLALNRYLVNTEGTVIRHGYTGYNAAISVTGQAPDGMQLSRSNGPTATLAKDLESAAAFRQRAIDDLKSLEDLRNAPVVGAEDYHGPVLFSGDAAADTFQVLFLPNIEADRPVVGTTARTQGAYSSSLHTPVLSTLLDVKDDPLLTTFAGQRLLGAYNVDDEGVPAQPVDIILSGKLMNFVIGREPVKDFPDSNGHGRAAPGQAAHSRSANAIFKSTQPLTAAQMNQQLLDLARKQGRDVYAVQTLGGELSPRLLYLVHPDGKRELVRGAAFDELDARSLRSGIVAVGSDFYVDNILGAVPQTVIAPSILFGDIEVKRATDEQQKLPYYEPPPASVVGK
jgi:TldD protein